MDLFDGRLASHGMVRSPDHATSIGAAMKVHRKTIRERVLDMAIDCGKAGITDDDLKASFPDMPESSFRKRRTELAQENVLLDTGRTRPNRHKQQEKVWMHRDLHHNPPPLVERQQPESKASQIVRLEARLRDLTDMVALALPYVEDALDDPAFSSDGKERILILSNRMKKAVQRETKGKDENAQS